MVLDTSTRNNDFPELGSGPKRLTHVDSSGAARMVDVSTKLATARSAMATGRFRTTNDVVKLLQAGSLAKGDALAVARIAGILGAKRTPELVPLCHPLSLTSVEVELITEFDSVLVRVTARTVGSTGVEMEALTGVAVAGLALHDMVKAVDPAAFMTDVRVDHKDGGKTGTWRRPKGEPA